MDVPPAADWRLWALLRICLNAQYKPLAILLALPRIVGSHITANLATMLVGILNQFELRLSFGHAITDNASEDTG